MNTKRFRKIFLPSVILLFSVLVLGQSAWACDEPNHGCDGRELDIQSVRVDVDNGLIYISGVNFDNGDFPEVTLGRDKLSPLNYSPYTYGSTKIVVALPPDIQEGHYKLVVSTGTGHNCRDKHSVHIPHHEKPFCPPPPSPTCPEGCKGDKGDKGDPGPKGDTGPAGPAGPGVTSAQAIPLPPDQQAYALLNGGVLTIGVPQGVQGLPGTNGTNGVNGTNGKDGANGLPGVSGYETNVQQFTFTLRPGYTSSADSFIVPPLSVPCLTSGKKLLGGGGGITSAPGINDVLPIMIYNGPALPPSVGSAAPDAWTTIWFNQSEYNTVPVTVQIYTICADVSP